MAGGVDVDEDEDKDEVVEEGVVEQVEGAVAVEEVVKGAVAAGACCVAGTPAGGDHTSRVTTRMQTVAPMADVLVVFLSTVLVANCMLVEDKGRWAEHC